MDRLHCLSFSHEMIKPAIFFSILSVLILFTILRKGRTSFSECDNVHIKPHTPTSSCEDLQEMHALALANLITPAGSTSSLQLSILPSFLCRLPSKIDTLRISFFVPALGWTVSTPAYIQSKLSYFSLGRLDNAVENDKVANIHIVFSPKTVTVAFKDVERPVASGELSSD
ncbi:hypothetical protein BT69DRAFT_245858 [Atractiella rhizophila]|nr:hypothetical protein BT69DRAFT_245858 [Atractiella rhizophila]